MYDNPIQANTMASNPLGRLELEWLTELNTKDNSKTTTEIIKQQRNTLYTCVYYT